jgi:hypothetical protein
MAVPQMVPPSLERWEQYSKRRFIKTIYGGISWLKSKLADWSDYEQFDAQVTHHGDVWTIHITVAYKTPSPSPFWVEAPQDELSETNTRNMVEANQKRTSGLHVVR